MAVSYKKLFHLKTVFDDHQDAAAEAVLIDRPDGEARERAGWVSFGT